MSQKNISENLEYHVDNHGVHLQAPIIEFIADNPDNATAPSTLSGTTAGWTVDNVAITTGTVTGSDTIFVGPAPTRTLSTYFPRLATYTKQTALVANTPADIDWSAFGTSTGSYGLAPSPGADTTFISLVGGTPTHWQFNTRGHWMWRISGTPTVALSDGATMTLASQYSSNAGGAFAVDGSWYATKGGAGTPAVNHIGGTFVGEYPFNALGAERVKFTATCTENKTVNWVVAWWFMNEVL